jgi:hypothetical protein
LADQWLRYSQIQSEVSIVNFARLLEFGYNEQQQ